MHRMILLEEVICILNVAGIFSNWKHLTIRRLRVRRLLNLILFRGMMIILISTAFIIILLDRFLLYPHESSHALMPCRSDIILLIDLWPHQMHWIRSLRRRHLLQTCLCGRMRSRLLRSPFVVRQNCPDPWTFFFGCALAAANLLTADCLPSFLKVSSLMSLQSSRRSISYLIINSFASMLPWPGAPL